MCGWGGAGELPEEEGEAAPDPEDDIIPMAEDHFEVGSATDASYYLKYIKHDFRPWRKYGIPRVSSSLPPPLLPPRGRGCSTHGLKKRHGAAATGCVNLIRACLLQSILPLDRSGVVLICMMCQAGILLGMHVLSHCNAWCSWQGMYAHRICAKGCDIPCAGHAMPDVWLRQLPTLASFCEDPLRPLMSLQGLKSSLVKRWSRTLLQSNPKTTVSSGSACIVASSSNVDLWMCWQHCCSIAQALLSLFEADRQIQFCAEKGMRVDTTGTPCMCVRARVRILPQMQKLRMEGSSKHGASGSLLCCRN